MNGLKKPFSNKMLKGEGLLYMNTLPITSRISGIHHIQHL